MKTKAFFLSLFTALLPLCLCAQNPDELDKRMGFKDIKLGDSVSVYPDFKNKVSSLSSKDVKVFMYRPGAKYSHIGDLKITEVELEAYKGHLYQILVWVEYRNYLMDAFVEAFGPVQKKSEKEAGGTKYQDFIWEAKQVRFTATHVKSATMEDLIMKYEYLPLIKEKDDHQKKTAAKVATDF